MSAFHKWQPVTDLPGGPNLLTDGELGALSGVWSRQKEELTAAGTLDEFEQRLRREWSIETGIIENVYTLDRGVTQTLIEKGIDASLIPRGVSNRDGVEVARIITDHFEALEGMFDFIRGDRPLSTSYIKALHSALLRNQETYAAVDQFGHIFETRLEKALYKTSPNSPTRSDGQVHEYCPPEHVAAEMDQLVAMHLRHQEAGIAPEIEAAWLHHRFTQIHPFADGNGRVARAIASLIFIRAVWFPMIVKRDDWSRYIDALEKADGGDLRTLVALFVEAQRTALIAATEIAFDVKAPETVNDAILAARDRMVRGHAPQPGFEANEHWKAESIANHLSCVFAKRVAEVAAQINREIGGPETFNTGTRKLDLVFAPIGRPHTGLVRVGLRGFGEMFLINGREDPVQAEVRFAKWLDQAIVAEINAWRQTL